MEQIAAYLKFIFIWEIFLNNWQCLVLQQSNQVFIWASVAKANSYPQGKQKIFLSGKKNTLYMQIHTQTQVAGNLFYHLMLTSYTDFQNTSSDVWCPIHVRFKIK